MHRSTPASQTGGSGMEVVQRRRTRGVNLMWSGARTKAARPGTRFDEQHNSSCHGKYFIFAAVSSLPLSVYPHPFVGLPPSRAVLCARFHIVIAVACVCLCERREHKMCGCHLDYSRANARRHPLPRAIYSIILLFFFFYHSVVFAFSILFGRSLMVLARLVRALLPAVLT